MLAMKMEMLLQALIATKEDPEEHLTLSASTNARRNRKSCRDTYKVRTMGYGI